MQYYNISAFLIGKMNTEALGKQIIAVGMLIVLAGAVIWLSGKLNLNFKLPGDIVFKRGNATFYFPLATSLILSIVLSVAMWLLRYFQNKP
jgi:hypothetical protein